MPHPHLQANVSTIIPDGSSISDGDDRPKCFGKDGYLVDGKWEQISWANDHLKWKASVISISSDSKPNGSESQCEIDPLSDSDDDKVQSMFNMLVQWYWFQLW